MLEKKTLIDQIEITRNGYIQVRFAKLIVDDGKEISKEWHRAAFANYHDIPAQIVNINKHLESMGYPAITDGNLSVQDIIDAQTKIANYVYPPEPE